MVNDQVMPRCEDSVFQNFSLLVLLRKAWEEELILAHLGKVAQPSFVEVELPVVTLEALRQSLF